MDSDGRGVARVQGRRLDVASGSGNRGGVPRRAGARDRPDPVVPGQARGGPGAARATADSIQRRKPGKPSQRGAAARQPDTARKVLRHDRSSRWRVVDWRPTRIGQGSGAGAKPEIGQRVAGIHSAGVAGN